MSWNKILRPGNRSRRAGLFLLVAVSLGAISCNDDPVATETGEDVTVEGIVADGDGLPQEGLFAHIVYGTTAAPIAVARDETNSQGRYSVSGKVPADQCHAVQIWVLEVGTFSAAADRLAREIVGQCGTSTMDIEVEARGPVGP